MDRKAWIGVHELNALVPINSMLINEMSMHVSSSSCFVYLFGSLFGRLQLSHQIALGLNRKQSGLTCFAHSRRELGNG